MTQPHPGSLELYEKVADWHDCPIPFSKTFGWERWGLFGVLADCILLYTQGDIVEIGVCETSIFLTKLAKKYRRHVYHCDLQRSVIENCLTVEGYFDENNTIYTGSSDDFFKEINFTPIAFGFIDGDHMYDHVSRDFDNLFSLLVDNGFILIHDTLPPNEEYLGESRCGTGYLVRQDLEKRSDIDILTFPFSAWNVGLTVVRKLPGNLPYYQENGR